jgi:membrane associated rhomboid family serine protease
LKGLRNRFDRFCFKHRDKGIPNLMLFIVLGCGIVSALSLLGYNQIYELLCFNRTAILRGQVWRLFSYIFTMSSSNILMTLLLLYCYYSLGSSLERSWGTLRFNLYYFTGIILMDIFAMAFGGIHVEVGEGLTRTIYSFSDYYASSMMNYLHLSMLICFATTYPDAQFYLFFFIPIKAWILALIYLLITLFEAISLTVPILFFPHNLFPLVALANYFLFFGKDVLNVIPMSWRVNVRRVFKKKNNSKTTVKTGTIVFPNAGSYQATTATVKAPYTHKCTVCGRTDVSNPELEFRYCSRCNGYHCYCEDHISNHTHVE